MVKTGFQHLIINDKKKLIFITFITNNETIDKILGKFSSSTFLINRIMKMFDVSSLIR